MKKNNIFQENWLYSDNQNFLESLYNLFFINSNNIHQYIDKNFEKKIFELLNSTSFFSQSENAKKFLTSSIFKKKNENFIKYPKKKIISENFLKFFENIKKYGHYHSNLNPLDIKTKNTIPELNLSYYKLYKKDLKILISENFLHFKKKKNTFQDIYYFFKKKYCKNIGYEFKHLKDKKEIIWLEKYIEEKFLKYSFNKSEKKKILKNLIFAETFEKFIHQKFPGSKRFSLEGCEILIPLLKKIFKDSFKYNIQKIFLGMTHRGRLNVMHNIFKENLTNIFKKFFGNLENTEITGDVKYHLGIKKKIFNQCSNIELFLLPNPSHLEIITPVVLGSCRAAINFLNLKNNNNTVLPIIIHGDSAFTGQGVVQETLNMSQVLGYTVSGSIHIIINNQIGFTTSNINLLRSSFYCTDIAKMIDSPIFHVNANDPKSVIFVITLALKFRMIFKKDVFIDLVCYRRLGHNEAEDPNVTQPLMYSQIKKLKSIMEIWKKKLIFENIKYEIHFKKFLNDYKKKLNQAFLEAQSKNNNKNLEIYNMIQKKKKKSYRFSKISFQKLGLKIFTIPKDFILHPQVKKIFLQRISMIYEKNKFDWGAAENLAYATLLKLGISCRITGQDVSRGTFSHRHALLHCQKNNTIYIPLKNNLKSSVFFEIWDSVLSEEAALAFEYGYSIQPYKFLTVWEAQFGDFCNGAQIVIDQFIASGFQKWGNESSLILLLPHGYDGQGPEHSSARIERFLQLCAQKNMKICIPTTASQMYHLLCEYGISNSKRPLIIFTPKSLLRNYYTFSTLEDFLKKKFSKILYKKFLYKNILITRIIFCAGKIYYELKKKHLSLKFTNILLIRLEQLYPFPTKKIKKILKKCTSLKECIWCQEEPENQGCWTYFFYSFHKYLHFFLKKIVLYYIGRSKFASTSEGSYNLHLIKQKKIIEKAFATILK
ncbi:2-oxoglutarate dehydrogenase E1 component [Buchnera aphidicola]|uniref:2-oxoglutarate dehydrogenase E1 component n=1 Tax=Buchnera aphidicola TaxID=9 RepID=UPI0031B6B1C9